ncbi:UDP-glucuronosyltransferase 2C1-like [Asterias rubens]|uniref:UDP-glucuronosyltransferase 2C1-like n=1 Tax=Asterias rubens TaxID=7604 RepID=UPI001454F511|nr:UDP-glucuronosyltransferase 2C1-like [Asterias rubens]
MVMSCINMPCADSKNILVVDSMFAMSHYQTLSLIGGELAGKGHNVTVLIGECMLTHVDTTKHRDILHFELYDCGITAEEQTAIKTIFGKLSLTGELSSFTWYAKMWLGLLPYDPEISAFRKYIFDNKASDKRYAELKDIKERLIALNFDLVVCDTFTPWCAVYAHDMLSLPYVNVVSSTFLGTRYTRWANSPSPLGYVPEFMTHYTDSMPFLQRVKNFLMHCLSLLIYDYISLKNLDVIRDTWGNRSSLSNREIMAGASLYVVNQDFLFEYPRPLQPNIVLCGGVSTREAQPLSQELEAFMQGSGDEGVLVFSFSTLVNHMDDKMADMIAGALARLPFRVAWKYMVERQPATLGNNTLLSEWIPQNDLLGHNKTKMFVYHGGANGAYEAIYHGVPVVGIPLFADQLDNMLRLRSRGMAEHFGGILEVTTDTLYEKIMKVATNPSYKKNAERTSAIYRSPPLRPLERAAFWIEHVMTHGHEHLQSNRGNMTWVQLNLLDIAGTLIAVCLVLALSLWWWCTTISKELS